MATHSKETVNVRAEVESVLGRELIGHEKAIVIHLMNGGMMNPLDIAKSMLRRHLENATTRQHSIANEVASLENELKAVKEKATRANTESKALKLREISTLDKMKIQANDVILCHEHIAKAESLAPVNVHSHGPLIEDMVESARRAYVLALAFQMEVQGR